MGAESTLSRRGVVRRLIADGGNAGRAAPAVVFAAAPPGAGAATGCSNCAWRAGASRALRVRTDLPDGTVVDVVASAGPLRRQALRVFAPPVATAFAAAAGASAAFGDAPGGDALAVLGLLVGMAAAIAVCRGAMRRRSASAVASEEAAVSIVATSTPADRRQAV